MDCREDPENCSSDKAPSILIEGMPGAVPTGVAELCKARLVEAVRELMDLSRVDEVSLSVRNEGAPRVQSASSSSSQKPRSEDELSVEERAEQCVSRRPFYDFDFLVVPAELRESLLSVDLGKLEKLVFERWNLKAIEPFPRTALNFHGPPGTGKTLAAHALADHLERPVLLASYAQIESKYVGDGAKNVEAVFFAAQRDKAVLFIDEVDSLLSRRLTNVTQGAEQAINSMRSQLLVCLEQFKGTIIFATNLVENYDRGFETRVRNLYFPMPDKTGRREIWRRHLPEQLPLAGDVSLDRLADIGHICGRDIKNAVIDAALRTARADRSAISHTDLETAMERVKSSRIEPGALSENSRKRGERC